MLAICASTGHNHLIGMQISCPGKNSGCPTNRNLRDSQTYHRKSNLESHQNQYSENSRISSDLCRTIGGTEAAIHAVREMYKSEEIEAVLLVDTCNAFNYLNRQTAFGNIPSLCLSLAPVLINSYRDSVNVYIDNSVILSQEGTTQGDPLAMLMWVIVILPLIRQLHPHENKHGIIIIIIIICALQYRKVR